MKTRLLMGGAVLALGMFAVVPGVSAQVTATDEFHQLRTEVTADRQAVVAANMKLTDAEGEAFWPVYRQYRDEMSKVGDRLQKLIQDYAKSYPNTTDDQAKKMVDEMLSIQKDQVKVRESWVSKFRKLLPETKVARLLQIENKIDAVISFGLADAIPLMKVGKGAPAK